MVICITTDHGSKVVCSTLIPTSSSSFISTLNEAAYTKISMFTNKYLFVLQSNMNLFIVRTPVRYLKKKYVCIFTNNLFHLRS